MVRCPICNGEMVAAGNIQVKNPFTRRHRTLHISRCKRCGYRTPK